MPSFNEVNRFIDKGQGNCLNGNKVNEKRWLLIHYQAPGRCPICSGELVVSRLSCPQCGSSLEGEFKTCRFCQLPSEQVGFIEVFLKCRGNIKEVEKEMGISYPTVRNRLEGVIQALGYKSERTEPKQQEGSRARLLDALERGNIDPEDVIEQLKRRGKL